jgi:uncharacterized protein YigA (DUF484 family)
MQRNFDDAMATPDVMAGDVRNFLIENPSFLADNADLLVHVLPPSAVRGDVVEDFQRYMLIRLQEDLQRTKDEHDDLMLLMQEHIQRQSHINTAILSLLDAQSFEQVLRFVTEDLSLTLDQEGVALFLEAQGDLQQGEFCGIRIVPPGFVRPWLKDQDVILQEPDDLPFALFGAAAQAIRSMALVRLSLADNLPPAMLALGHRETLYYTTGLATEQVECLGAVIERCWRKWL